MLAPRDWRVLDTARLQVHKHVLHNVYWHRMIVDEAQLAMAGFLADREHRCVGRVALAGAVAHG